MTYRTADYDVIFMPEPAKLLPPATDYPRGTIILSDGRYYRQRQNADGWDCWRKMSRRAVRKARELGEITS